MNVQFEEVPPPSKAPVNQIAETMGVIDGLRAERNHSNCRCSNCRKWIRAGDVLVWMPDGMSVSDPHDIIIEQARRFAWNGHWTAVCGSCAPKKSRSARAASGPAKWWQFWL